MTIKQQEEYVAKYAKKLKLPSYEYLFLKGLKSIHINSIKNTNNKQSFSISFLIKHKNIEFIYKCSYGYQYMKRKNKLRFYIQSRGILLAEFQGRIFTDWYYVTYRDYKPARTGKFTYKRQLSWYQSYELKEDFLFVGNRHINKNLLRILIPQYETAFKEGWGRYVGWIETGKWRNELKINQLQKKDLPWVIENIEDMSDMYDYKNYLSISKTKGWEMYDPNWRTIHNDYLQDERTKKKAILKIKEKKAKEIKKYLDETKNIQLGVLERIKSLYDLKEHGINQNHCVGVVHKEHEYFWKIGVPHTPIEITIMHDKSGYWEIRTFNNINVSEKVKHKIKQLVIKDAERRWNDAIQNAKQ